MKYLEYTATEDDRGKTVKEIIKREFQISAAMLAKLKRIEKGITVDGLHKTVRHAMLPGETLRLLAETLHSRSVMASEGELDIVYEDDWILILCKPHGIPVHPSRGHFDDTLANRVVHYYEKTGQTCAFRAMNRLDRGTGGLLCIAKTQYSAGIISNRLAAGEVQREYIAVIDGHLPLRNGTITAPIERMPGSGIKRHVSPTGKMAVTHYSVIQQTAQRSLVRLRLETGRTHQIRVHMSHLNCPVTGDFLYGTEQSSIHGHALFAEKLAFFHPKSGEKLVFTRRPWDFFRLLMHE